MVPPKDLLTMDGYDLQFGTNVLGMRIVFLNTSLSQIVCIRAFLLHQALIAHPPRYCEICP
jgi:hypothetical protein